MSKEFIINLLFLVGINLLIKPFYVFGIDLGVQNQLGPEAYGLYFVLFNFSFLFQIISDMGLQPFCNRFSAQHPKLVSKYLPQFLFFKLGLGFLFLLISLSTAYFLGYLSVEIWDLTFLLLLNQILLSMIIFLRSFVSGSGFYRIDSLFSVLDKLLLIIIMSILLYTPFKIYLELRYFILSQSLSLLVTLISTLFFLGKTGILVKLRAPQWAVLLLIIKKSGPYALAVLLMTVYSRLDAVMIEQILAGKEGKIQTGIYAFGYRLLDAFNIIGYLFAGLLLPMYSKLLSDKKSCVDLSSLALRIMLILTIFLSFSIWFNAENLCTWLLWHKDNQYASVLQLLIWTTVASGCIYVWGSLLTAADLLKRMNQVFVLGLGVNIISNLICIPLWGAWGAALSTLITQSLVALGEFFILIYSMQEQRKKLLSPIFLIRIFVFIFGTYFIIGASSTYLSSLIDWRISSILGILFVFAWTEVIGLLRISEILLLFKGKSQ